MREILFRGKRIDNGEWVDGFLFEYAHGGTCIGHEPLSANDYSEIYSSCYCVVDPATVGQYTGLVDKNGKKIFEGDVVHCVAWMDQANCVVVFENGEFRLVPERHYKAYTAGAGFHALRCFAKEITGNIHDTELKEV